MNTELQQELNPSIDSEYSSEQAELLQGDHSNQGRISVPGAKEAVQINVKLKYRERCMVSVQAAALRALCGLRELDGIRCGRLCGSVWRMSKPDGVIGDDG